MKNKSLISLVCVAVLSQYGLAPITTFAMENEETITETASNEELTTEPNLDNLPQSSTQFTNGEEASAESENTTEETTSSTPPEVEKVEAKSLDIMLKDPNQALVEEDDFIVKISGSETVAKLHLPEGISYDSEKNTEELRTLVDVDSENRLLTFSKVNELEEIEVVLTVEKTGEYELQLINESNEAMGEKLSFTVAEKSNDVQKELEQKTSDHPKEETMKEEQKKIETKEEIKKESRAGTNDSRVGLDMASDPTSEVTSASQRILYTTTISHTDSTKSINQGKLVITIENGKFKDYPNVADYSSLKSSTLSSDGKTITLLLNDGLASGNFESYSYSAYSSVGITHGTEINVKTVFTGVFTGEFTSFANEVEKKLQVNIPTGGIQQVVPGTSSWTISPPETKNVYPGNSFSDSIGLYNVSKNEGFRNLRFKLHFSDKNKIDWFVYLKKQFSIYYQGGGNSVVKITPEMIDTIDDQTFILNFGEMNPEDIERIYLYFNSRIPNDAATGEQFTVDVTVMEDMIDILSSTFTYNVIGDTTEVSFVANRDGNGSQLSTGQKFCSAYRTTGMTSKEISDYTIMVDVPKEVTAKRVINGLTGPSTKSIDKLEFYDGNNWQEVSEDSNNNFTLPDVTIKKLRIKYSKVKGTIYCHQPFRIEWQVKDTATIGTNFDLKNSLNYTDSSGNIQTPDVSSQDLSYEIVGTTPIEQTTKVTVAQYNSTSDFDNGSVVTGDKFKMSYRVGAASGKVEQPYVFIKLPKGIKIENINNTIQYPYGNDIAYFGSPKNGKTVTPISKANTVGSFEASDGNMVYYYKADDTSLSREDYIQMLLIENEYTVENIKSGIYEVEVGIGSLKENYEDATLNNGYTASTLSAELQSKLGATSTAYYSKKTKMTVGKIDKVTTSVAVKGSEDAAWLDSSKTGKVVPGKKVSYRVSIKNEGTENYSNVQLVNILPYVGDTLVSSSTARNSQFQINPDSSGVSVKYNGGEASGVTLDYSLSNDPVRFTSPSGDTIGVDPWVSSVSDFSRVRAIRVSAPSVTLKPGDEITLEYSGVVVLDAQRPQNPEENFVANNSVAYRFETDEEAIRAGEPAISKVQTIQAEENGLISGNVYIDLNKDGNKSSNDPGLNQVQFELYKKNDSGQFVSTGLTSESTSNSLGDSGIFGFNDLEYGTYKVKVILPSTKGAEFITSGTDKVDKIDDTSAWIMKGGSSEFTINDATETSNEIKDLSVPIFVNTPLNGTISFKNKAGVVIPSNYGKDCTVELYKGTSKIATTTSKDNGAYSFDDLSINSKDDYKIKVTIPSGKSFVFTTDNSSGELTVEMEPGIGTKAPTDIYITDTDNPTGEIKLVDGHEAGKDVNPSDVEIKAEDATTDTTMAWEITQGGTVEYSGTSDKAKVSLADYVDYLVGDKKAGEFEVKAVITDAAGNTTTVTKKFTIKYGTVKYMVGTIEHAKEESLLLYVDKLTKPATDPTKAGYTFDKWVTEADLDWNFATGIISDEDLVLKATFKAEKQTITFDVNGGDEGTKPDDIEQNTDEVVSLGSVTAPTRVGYTFKHWYKKGDASKANVGASVTMPAGGMELVAEWEANSYKVSFNKNDGTGTMADQNFKYDTAQNLTTNVFTRDGYTFQGWATSASGVKEYDNSANVKNLTAAKDGTVTLYAVWKAEKQTIQFDVNGGDPSTQPNDIQKDTGETVDLSTVDEPTRTGYSFKHWYKQGDASKANVGTSVTMPADGMTLVAEWEANSYKVSFDNNGGTGTMTNQNFKYDTAQNLKANTFTKDGYTFQGWAKTKTGAYTYLDGASVNNLTDEQDGTVTLYAVWKADRQVIQFDVNGGNVASKPGNISSDTDSTVDLKDVVAPTRTGYTFKHWYKQGDTDKTAVGNSIKMPAGGVILVAEWEANTYTVNFHKNGGTGSMTAQSFTYDESKKLTKNSFEREGYTFVGWSTTSGGSSSFTDEASVSNLTATKNGTVDLYAVWSAGAQVIQFDVNGGDTSSKPGNISGNTDEVINLSGVATPTRTGYSFKHWYKKGDAAKANVGISVTMPAKGMTLVAEWEANTYKVKFNANGGTKTMSDQDFVYDTAQTLTENQFEHAGYSFQGWSTTAAGAASYADKASVSNLTADVNGEVELFAVWKAEEQTIQFDVNGGDVTSKPNDIKKDTANTVDLSKVKAPTRTGYTFKHWYKQGDDSKADVGNSVTMPAGGLTLVAEWEANSYKVSFNNNGGTGTMLDQDFTYDTEQTLTTNRFSRVGYAFQGWTTSSVGFKEYDDGENVENLTAEANGMVTLYAVWKAEEQMIQFDVNGGDVSSKPDDIKKDTNTTVDLRDVEKPTRTGYSFKHWYKQGDASETNIGASIKMPAGGLTLVAKWEANSYKVSFDNNGGTGTMTNQNFKYDTVQNLKANTFTKDGYSFQGWSKTKTGAYAYLDSASVKNLTDEQDGTVTLYAVWKADSQVVQFDVNGGDISTNPGNISGDTDSTVDLKDVTAPTRTGYTFKHWYKQDDTDKTAVGNSIKMPAGGVTLVAEWQANIYTINFHKNGGTGSMTAQSFKYDESKKLTKNSFEKDGYTFVGWATAANGSSTYTDEEIVSNLTDQKAGTIDLYALWSASAQVIQFDVNGGDVTSKPGNITGDTDDVISLSGVAAPTRTGYTFKHWYKKGDAAKADVGTSVTMPAKGMTLVAEWKANTYKVKFNANGGTKTMSDQAFVYDTAQTLSGNQFERPGYSFAGWATTATGAASYADKATVSNLTADADGEVELFAVWKADKQTIQFDVNGGNASSKPVDIFSETDSNVDLTKVSAPTRTGYTFGHWYRQNDTTKSPVFGNIAMPAGGMRLVADWKANNYTVQFDANGGSGTMNDQSFVYDIEQRLTVNSFSRPNYDFVGWSNRKNGPISFTNKEIVKNLTTIEDGSQTLYAIWKLQESVITFDVNGGDEKSRPEDIRAQIGTTVSLKQVKTPTRSGYTFTGWYIGTTKVGDSVEMTENGMKLVAHWSPNDVNAPDERGTGSGNGSGTSTKTNNANVLAKSGVSGKATSTNTKALPHTNDTPTIGMSVVGGLFTLLAFFGFKKKKEDDSETESE
ncbi:InlB B-repeat-containing protein [Enterococcus raffinosus]|uniref:InlB B-repeat-containing protein n=1 Tax=Enterococcus raffinosus TaxID=71452 RepID=UPI001C11AC89|nr:InlB B-repeat-containing protein [Enterococcus raffinosus]MBU5359615.1 InlB B-repeat-containing protein [Enterococcus raffinosus]